MASRACSRLVAPVVVKLSSAAYANITVSGEPLRKDPQVYSTSVHIVLGAFVREARDGASGRQQAGSMQDAGYGLPRTPLLGTSVNKGRKKGRSAMPLPFAAPRSYGKSGIPKKSFTTPVVAYPCRT